MFEEMAEQPGEKPHAYQLSVGMREELCSGYGMLHRVEHTDATGVSIPLPSNGELTAADLEASV